MFKRPLLTTKRGRTAESLTTKFHFKRHHSRRLTFVSAFQLIVPVFLIFQYLMNLVPGRSRVPSGRFSSRKAAVMAGTTRGQGRFGRLGRRGRSAKKILFDTHAEKQSAKRNLIYNTFVNASPRFYYPFLTKKMALLW